MLLVDSLPALVAEFGTQCKRSCRQSLNSKKHSSQSTQARHLPTARGLAEKIRKIHKNVVKQEKEFGTTASTGGSPAKSTRLTLADSMVVRPASSVVLLSTTQVKTEWDRLDSLFMLVAAVCLFCCPRRSRRAVSSTAGTTVCCHRCLLMWLTTAMEFKGQRGLI